MPLEPPAIVLQAMHDTLDGKPSEFMQSTVWNGGFYLWRCGVSPSVEAGVATATMLLTEGRVKQTLQTLQRAVSPVLVQ